MTEARNELTVDVFSLVFGAKMLPFSTADGAGN